LWAAPTIRKVIEFREGRIDSGDGQRLERAMAAEMCALYDGLDLNAHDMPKAGPAEMNPPSGAFLIGYEAEQAVCCGGIKNLGDRACEIKRMYVAPQARGRGLARTLLTALEDHARGLGYAVAKLDTGPKQQHAMRIYRSAGYREVPNFNGNPVATFFAEKPL
jgi:GNAT superfamily N-acetyltransferase